MFTALLEMVPKGLDEEGNGDVQAGNFSFVLFCFLRVIVSISIKVSL